MEESQNKKKDLRHKIIKMISEMSENELKQKNRQIEERLFDFANFLEAGIPLLYLNTDIEVNTRSIIKRSYKYNKTIVLPLFGKNNIDLLRVEHMESDLKTDASGNSVPDASVCRSIPFHIIDIALVPGIAFDEKGGRLGNGSGSYDRLIPKLPSTTRKVGLAFECQIVPQVHMLSHDRHVDIIITEDRIIYKI